jgi:hypothetical protein
VTVVWTLKWKYITLIGKIRAVFSEWQTLSNVSPETICLHPPNSYMADAHGIGSACAEYQRAFIESHAKTTCGRHIALVAKGMLLLIVA